LKHDNDDIDDYSSVELDRSSATFGAEVHLTVTDQALNIDPTTEDVVMFKVDSGYGVSFKATSTSSLADYDAFNNGFDDNGKLKINYGANDATKPVLVNEATLDDETADNNLIFFETAENSGIFVNTDDDDESSLNVNTSALTARGTTATIDYADSAQSFTIAHDFATIDMDASSVGDEWNSGEEMTIVLYDQDLNLNTFKDEDLSVENGTLVPSIQIGNPVMVIVHAAGAESVSLFSNIAILDADVATGASTITINTGYTYDDIDAIDTTYTYANFDFRSFGDDVSTVTMKTLDVDTDGAGVDTADGVSETLATLADGTDGKGLTALTMNVASSSTDEIVIEVVVDSNAVADVDAPFTADVFSFDEATNNAIYRVELEETGDNTATFEGSAEYVMLNQINYNLDATYDGVNPTQDGVDMIVHLDDR
jgi:hypothetical protein